MANHPNRSLPPLSRALKAWRAREGLTQAQAAERFALPLTSWTDLEQRNTAPRTNSANVAGEIILSLITLSPA